MQEGQPWGTVEKGHDGGRFVKAFLRRPPRLQRAPGPIKRRGGLTQGEPLGLQSAIRIEELRALEAIPAGGAILIALCCGLDDGSHGDLRVLILRLCIDMAQDGEVAYAFQPFTGVEALILWDSLLG
jgi:hypothetical protein